MITPKKIFDTLFDTLPFFTSLWGIWMGCVDGNGTLVFVMMFFMLWTLDRFIDQFKIDYLTKPQETNDNNVEEKGEE